MSRPLPPKAALMLGAAPVGFLAFAQAAAEAGFGLSHPSDDSLTDERWEEIAEMRVASLLYAFRRAPAPVSLSTETPR